MTRAINDLLLARAKAITELQEMAAKSAGKALDATDAAKYATLKAAIEDFGAKIEDLKKYEAETDKGFKPVGNKENNGLANYIRFGATIGLQKSETDFVKAARRLGIPEDQIDRTGFAPVVPEEYEKTVFAKAKDASLFLKLAKKIPCGSSSKIIPIGNADSTAYWRKENGSYSDSSATSDKKTLTAYNLYCLSKISRELLEDADFDVEAYVAENQGAVMGEKIDSTFFSNAAAVADTSPKGLFDDMTAKAMTGASLSFKDINATFMSLKQAYRTNGVWVAPSAFILAVMDMTDEVGRPIYIPSYELGKPDRLLGKPLYEASQFGNVTINGGNKAAQALFADWNKIAYGERRGMSIQRLSELYAGNGQIGIISDTRLDGCVIIQEAATVLHVK